MHIFTSDLPDKKRCCRLINMNFRLLFRHWTTSVALSALWFQLAAGQVSISVNLQPLVNQITSNLTSLQAQATAATQQLQVAANATIQNITSQIQASLDCALQYVSILSAAYPQVQACLNLKIQGLAAIANATRKQIIIIHRYTE